MDHSAFCSEESEVILQWLNLQCSNQTMQMQPEFLNLNNNNEHDSPSNFLSNFDQFCNADPTYYCSSLPSLGNESLNYQQQGMMQCIAEDAHVMPYLNVGIDINQQHVYNNAFTDEAVGTGNALETKGKRKLEIGCYEKKETTEDSECCLSDNVPKKKSRPSVRALRKNKNRKDDSSNGESSSCSSEDELTGESAAGNQNLKNDRNGKSKGSKGSATDSQSVYARKRREKINQRLRTLQKLVPNGTKVDISTMLEEAVQYVKFLQTQIKLLSSDDLWMYAPLAYNGVNMNIDLSICQ